MLTTQKVLDQKKLAAKAPFPYFGGKSVVARQVWSALGQPKRYIEPFCGSCAVLLARPNYDPEQHVETINGAEGHIANVWRAIKLNPDEVAKWCDWPINHVDLWARRNELLRTKNYLLTNLVKDPKWHDPILAGYYIWTASYWIGGRLLFGDKQTESSLIHPEGGVRGSIPSLSDKHRKVHALHNIVYDWMQALSNRLRNVRVICGDWTRVCGGNWQDSLGNIGIFFDPPYDRSLRDRRLYSVDSPGISRNVREWCLKRGESETYRIVLAGYYEEHESLLHHGWSVKKWKAQGGYGNQGNGRGKENRNKEALFFSPYCLSNDLPLFEAGEP